MVLRPLKLTLQSLSRPYRFHKIGIVSLLLVASCSGLGFFLKRILLQKLRLWIWRVILEKDMQVRNTDKEAAAMAAATAVKAAASAAAQVACLSQVMLTVQAEEKHQTKNLVSALQAVSLKLTKAELIMRGFVDEMDRTKKLSPKNGMTSGPSSDQRYNLRGNLIEHIQSAWKAPSSNVNWVSNTRGIPVETPQPTIQNSTPQSPSFLEVMAMLERGETPPGIKKINDKPPIPNQLPSVSCLQPKPKPWEMEDRASNSILKFRT